MGQFFISHEGNQQGPFSLDHICQLVKEQKLGLVDYIYDDQKSDWVMLMQFEELAQKLKSLKPAAPPKVARPEPPAPEPLPVAKPGTPSELVAEWFVLKGENKFGPFSFSDLIKMMQEKTVFEFDFVWHSGLSTWKRVAELECFKPEKIREIKSSLMPEISEVFFRRRHRRMSYNGTILVHDNRSVWKAKGVEISAAGAGVVMENSIVQPGQTLYLHFKPCDGVPAFNAICEVVSKQYVDGVKDSHSAVKYGVKFTSVSANTQKLLQELSKKAEAA